MNIEDELKHKACNIELFAKKAVEDIAALEQYSGWMLNRTNQIQAEMDILRRQNKKLIEALKFYADVDMYEYYDKYESTAVKHDGGQKARDCLKEIEK